jgi:hypothetical protein
MERNLAPAPAVDVVAAQPIVRPDVAAPAADLDVLATLVLGLVGGLVGGGAAIGGGPGSHRPPGPERRQGRQLR